jgi:hypothetical protein
MRSIALPDASWSRLQQLAIWSSTTIDDVLRVAIDEHYEKVFFAECDRGYEHLKADPIAWQKELEERALWDNTIGDGLNDV